MKNNKNTNGQFVSDAQKKKSALMGRGIIFIVILVTVCSYLYLRYRHNTAVVSIKTATLGISKSFLSIPVYIAQEQGYFADAGLDLTIREYPSGKLATQAMLAGDMDISTVADMPIVVNSFRREDFCVAATFTSSYAFVKLIARQDSGIRTAADLKGKKIGLNRGTSSHFFLATLLIHHHLSMPDVEILHRKTVDLPDALNSGEADAVSVWQPYAQQAQQLLGNNALELPGGEIYRATFSFAVRKGFATERREILEAFLRAIDNAATFILQHRDESQDIIVKRFGLDRQIVREAWDDFTFGISLDHAFLIGLEDIARWSIRNQFTDQDDVPNYLNYICSAALEAVKPESITLIR